jgi:uncharacterized protein
LPFSVLACMALVLLSIAGAGQEAASPAVVSALAAEHMPVPGSPLQAVSQTSPKSDLELLSDAACSHCGHVRERQALLLGRDSHWLIRYNPVSLAFSGMMFVYQRFVSPQLPSQCLYEHSCSEFSKELIGTYGLARGIVFTTDRLSRCNRVAALDVHPLSISETSRRVVENVDIYKISGE